jgi:hypothetical protein
MQHSNPVLTSQNLAELYQVRASTIRILIDRIGLGTRLGRWRIVQPSELERLEAGIQALGHRIPPEARVATKQHALEEEQPVVEVGGSWK